MTCWIPSIPELGRLCPATLLRKWLCTHASLSSSDLSPLFCVTSAPTKAMSYDSWRKTLAAHFQSSDVGTHSLRKGGAHWYKHVAGASPDTVQSQGGWSSAAVMNDVYTNLSAEECRTELLKSVARAFLVPDSSGPSVSTLVECSRCLGFEVPCSSQPSGVEPAAAHSADTVWWVCDLAGCLGPGSRIMTSDPYRWQRKYSHLHSVRHTMRYLETLQR